MKRLCVLYFVMIWVAAIGISRCPIVHADEGRWLAQKQILLYGLGLNVEPAHQTVPKDIATIVSTYLQAPDSIPEGTLPIPEDAEVRATLRGPSLSQPVELVTRVNEHFEIQPFQLSGIHTLENIRVVHNDEVILYATPESVTIEVIDHLLETPEVNDPIELVRPHVLYEYSDPNLEALSSGQKLLLRMGSDNAARIKGTLRELRVLVTAM